MIANAAQAHIEALGLSSPLTTLDNDSAKYCSSAGCVSVAQTGTHLDVALVQSRHGNPPVLRQVHMRVLPQLLNLLRAD